MKRLVCEMCAGTELIKEDGVFVCQSCGCRYSLEEAKKLIIEGTVDVSGSTVKVDNSQELKNLYQLARRARDGKNKENTVKYYDMILLKEPASWEAVFYIVCSDTWSYKPAAIQSVANSISNCLKTVLKLVKTNVTNRNDQIEAVREISTQCMKIATTLYDAAKKHSVEMDRLHQRYRQELVSNCFATRDIMYLLGNNIDSIFSSYRELYAITASAWKTGIEMHNYALFFLTRDSGQVAKREMQAYAAKIKKYEPTYTLPKFSEGNSGGCYVATAVYGSYDCPEVWTLRRFRDYELSKTWYGRAFIYTYYAISPTLVRWFGKNEWFKRMWKGKLDLMVKKLQDNGFESSPYEDINW